MSGFTDDDYSFDRKSGDLMTWLKQRSGVNVSHKIRLADLRDRGAGRGVVATMDIAQGEELFTIPLSEVLSVKTSPLMKTHLGPTLQQLDEWLAMTLVLLFEIGQGDRSHWSAYLKILPTTFDTLMHWESSELKELRGCAVLGKIGREDAERAFTDQLLPIIKKYGYMFPQYESYRAGKNFDTVFLRNAHTMATLIMAYAFDLEEEQDQDDDASDSDRSFVPNLPKGMVPLADMLNADGDRNNAHLIQNEDSMSMVAITPIHSGDEIFNDYGRLPRSDLLRRYGYITDKYKKWDVVEISTDTVVNVARRHCRLDEQSEKRRLVLARKWGFGEDAFELGHDHIASAFGLDRELYLLIDVLTMDQKTLEDELDSHEVPGEPRFTNQVGLVLKEILLERLRFYQTTIAEDASLLQDNCLSKRLRLAVEVRMGEKELIATALDGLQHHMEIFDENDSVSRESVEVKSPIAQAKKVKIGSIN